VLDRAAAGPQLDDPVDQGEPRLGVVVDDEQGGVAARGDPADRLAHQRGTVGVQLRGGLVEQQQARLGSQRPGEHQPLLLPSGEGAGGPVTAVGEAHLGQHAVDGRPDPLARHSGVLQPERDVVPGAGHDQLRVGVLEDDAGAGPGVPRRPAVDGDRAGLLPLLRAEQPGERVQQGGLARPGRAGEQHPLAGGDGQVDLAGRPGVPAGVAEPPAGQPHPGRRAAGGAVFGRRRQTRVRPDANADSAPLAASERVRATAPAPAITMVLTATRAT
jgi:hypothetical protein